MEKKLTNESIKMNFDNQFDLVNYAIKLATNMIQCHREPRVKVDSESHAIIVLEEIRQGKDFLENVYEEELEESGKYSTASEVKFQSEEVEIFES